MQEPELTEITPSYAPQQPGASILYFHILVFLGTHWRKWLQSEAGRSQVFFSFLSALRAKQLIVEHCNH